MWPFPLQHLLKCSPNMLLWEQPLLPVLDVFSVGRVGIRPSAERLPYAAAAERLPCMTQDPTYSRTPRGSLQDHCYWAASLEEHSFHHRPTRDPLHNRRQASDSQLLTSCVSPEQEAGPCYACLCAVGVVTGWSVPRAIRDWVAVRGRRRIQDH